MHRAEIDAQLARQHPHGGRGPTGAIDNRGFDRRGCTPDRALRKEAVANGWPVLTFSRPVSLRDRLPAPSGAAVATTAAVGISAVAAGALTYSLLRRRVF